MAERIVLGFTVVYVLVGLAGMIRGIMVFKKQMALGEELAEERMRARSRRDAA
ncbi:MAG TPA: hypothetical protein VHT53_10620 [Candidatus Elarobacter sp.]|jgi:uncharacterized membrane protein YuzA (DUF378 family)|nr:hypothetical protein [Candidatus Elarobacter sp.]